MSLALRRWEPDALAPLGFGGSGRVRTRGNCLAAPALGPAPARLICGEHLEQARKLEPYLTRGLPLEALGPAPVQFVLRPAPLQGIWRELKPGLESAISGLLAQDDGGDAADGAAVRAIAAGLFAETDAWARSVENVVAELVPTPEAGFELAVTIRTRDPQPWLMAANERVTAAPAALPSLFDSLPPQATSAGFMLGFAPRDMRVLTDATQTLLRSELLAAFDAALVAMLPQFDVAKELLQELVTSPCVAAREMVWASVPYETASAKPASVAEARLRSWLGHGLFAAPREAGCADLVRRNLNRFVTSKELREALKSYMPDLAVRKVAAPRRLGKATAFELDVSTRMLEFLEFKSRAEAAWPLQLFAEKPELGGPVMLVPSPAPEDARTKLTLIVHQAEHGDWIGFSADAEQLARVMEQLGRQAAVRGPGLARLRQPHTLNGEYFDLTDVERQLASDPRLRALIEAIGGPAVLRERIVSTTRVYREQGTLNTRVSYFLSPLTVAAVKRLSALDAERLEAIGLTPDGAANESP